MFPLRLSISHVLLVFDAHPGKLESRDRRIVRIMWAIVGSNTGACCVAGN
jgi:hypothetical protein